MRHRKDLSVSKETRKLMQILGEERTLRKSLEEIESLKRKVTGKKMFSEIMQDFFDMVMKYKNANNTK